MNVGTGTFSRWELAAMWVWKVNIEQTERQSTQGLFPALFSSQRSQTFWKHQTTNGTFVPLTFKYLSVADLKKLPIANYFAQQVTWLINDSFSGGYTWFYIWGRFFCYLSLYEYFDISTTVSVPDCFCSNFGFYWRCRRCAAILEQQRHLRSEWVLSMWQNHTIIHLTRITLKCFYEVSFYYFWLFAAFISAEDS